MTASPQKSLFNASLPPRLDLIFAPMCVALPESEAPGLKQQVIAHTEEVRAALSKNEFIDIATAERVGKILVSLLDEYNQHADEHRPLIVAAARYFVHSHDAEPDIASVLGFDDDVEVLNFVLDAIGRSNLRIDP